MRYLLLTLSLFVAIGCSEKDHSIDPLIYINGQRFESRAAANEFDSLKFITTYTWEWSAYSEEYKGSIRRCFGLNERWANQRDTVNNKLMLLDIDVIAYEGILGGFVVDLTDIVLTTQRSPEGIILHPKDASVNGWAGYTTDTIGYIPNRVVLKAREDITKAFNADNMKEVQRLFNEAYVFIPTTGAKWRAMKAAGIE